MLQPGRSVSSGTYRFGYQGQEMDNAISGTTGTHTTAQFWEYDTRAVKRWNLDPVVVPSLSGYSVFANNPILLIDPLGSDTALYQLYSGAEMECFRKKSNSPQTPIWVVDELAKGYNSADPWATAMPLMHDVTISGNHLRCGHPLECNVDKTRLRNSQVYVEELYDVANDFYNIIREGYADFNTLRRSSGWDFEYYWRSRYLTFALLVAPNAKYDLKSLNESDGTASFAPRFIGDWSLLNGRLRAFDDYGNISYGIFGTYSGFTGKELVNGASIAQRLDNGQRSIRNLSFDISGDPQRDTYTILMGIDIYNKYLKHEIK
jgi:hypothetical protein